MSPTAPDVSCLWQWIRLEEYGVPTEATTEVVRKGIRGLWERLRPAASANESTIVRPDWRVAPEKLLEHVAPSPCWEEPGATLQTALEEWLTAETSMAPMQVIVGAPYSGIPQIVSRWARLHGWHLIDAPIPEQILAGGDEWFAMRKGSANLPFVLPHLGRHYLRHTEGLSFFRRLLDGLWSVARRGVIACDSWAWAYLGKALQIDALFPPPWTLQAFDHLRLQHWLRALAQGSSAGPWVFRHTDSGRFVLPPDAEPTPPHAALPRATADVSDFVTHVAAYSRGIPGVAWAVWRQSLRLASADGNGDKVHQVAEDDHRPTIWVKPWSQLNLPGVPASLPPHELFVLHTVLLHETLPADLLPHLLPFSAAEVLRYVQHLRAVGLLEAVHGRWRVPALVYPAVRSRLQREGYIVDAI
jgi:hypothetical protein